MKITYQQKQKLMKNWESVDSLRCNAEIRLYDPISSFQCYIVGMYEDDEDQIYCIMQTNKCAPAIATLYTMYQLDEMYNEHGEGLEIDTEYRPRQAQEILTQLRTESRYAS
jgi:hypothetical protein